MRNTCRLDRACSGCARWKATPGATSKTPPECQKLHVFCTNQSLMNTSPSPPTVQSLVIPTCPYTRVLYLSLPPLLYINVDEWGHLEGILILTLTQADVGFELSLLSRKVSRFVEVRIEERRRQPRKP